MSPSEKVFHVTWWIFFILLIAFAYTFFTCDITNDDTRFPTQIIITKTGCFFCLVLVILGLIVKQVESQPKEETEEVNDE